MEEEEEGEGKDSLKRSHAEQQRLEYRRGRAGA